MFSKGSVMTMVAGVPRVSIWIASCKLHEVQAPQSPTPVITIRDRAAMSWASLFSMGFPADGFE